MQLVNLWDQLSEASKAYYGNSSFIKNFVIDIDVYDIIKSGDRQPEDQCIGLDQRWNVLSPGVPIVRNIIRRRK